MNLSITQYEITRRDIIESVFGILAIISGIIGSVVVANIITSLISNKQKNINDRKINIMFLIIHILIIFYFVMLIKYLSKKYIHNPLILDSTSSFIGPTIALTSLYLSQNFKVLAGSITYISTN
jgi:hypothetical protein